MRAKAFGILLLCVGLSAGLVPPSFALTLLIGGKKQVLRVEAIGGYDYLSLQEIQAATKARLERYPKGGYLLRFSSTSLSFHVGQSQVLVGEKTYPLSAPPRRITGKVLVPVELLSLALEEVYGPGRVVWDTEKQLIRVEKRPYSLRLLRFRSYPDHTRIVLEATRPLPFFLRQNRRELILEVKDGLLSPSIRSQEVRDGLVRSIEPKQESHGARFSIRYEDEPGQTRAFALKGPDRIVVDIFKADPSVSSSAPQRFTTVVIDPGHGGKDTGAIGPQGLKEKDVVLDIALKLKRFLEGRLSMKVMLTRSEDIFIPLEERTALANRARADFFVSIHANAAIRSRAVGFETYFWSKEASDADARASAIRENLVLTTYEGLTPREQENLKALLWDLVQDRHIKDSAELAEILLDELDKILKVENRGVKHGPFFVLTGAAMPAVLVEVAFISNPLEERKLREEAYRLKVAEALYEGIAKFKVRYERRMGMRPSGDHG